MKALLVLLAIRLSGIAPPHEPMQLRPSVTVQEFDTDRTGWMPPPHFGVTVADLLTDRLMASGTLRVIDRERRASGDVDYVVAGAVTRLSIEKRSSTGAGLLPLPIAGGLLRKSTTMTVIGLTIRVINARTGEVVATAMAESGASDKITGGGGIALVGKVPVIAGKSASATGVYDRLLDAAVQDAVTAAAKKIIAQATSFVR